MDRREFLKLSGAGGLMFVTPKAFLGSSFGVGPVGLAAHDIISVIATHTV